MKDKGLNKGLLIWIAVGAAVGFPLVVAARSPLLEWRDPTYIAAGFSGVLGLGLLLIQPLLAAGHLPGMRAATSRRVHRLLGFGLLVAILVHVAGLWVTSPPDVIDALLFRSPTPFSVWGVLAMWGIVIAAALAVFRRHVPLRPVAWRRLHLVLTGIVVLGTIVHALLIQGAMGQISKIILCVIVGACFLGVGIRRLCPRR